MINLSTRLERLFTSHKSIKLMDLEEVFGEKSFALAFILLMMTAALPLPTGGITHFFEIVTVLLALELVAGRRAIWIPKRWEKRSIHSPKPGKGMGRLVGFVRFFEKFSRTRGHFIANHHLFVRLIGIFVIMFASAAFLAPPFSGLDTLPALGVVILSIGMVLDDLVVVAIGIIIGILGIVVIIGLGGLVLGAAQQAVCQISQHHLQCS